MAQIVSKAVIAEYYRPLRELSEEDKAMIQAISEVNLFRGLELEGDVTSGIYTTDRMHARIEAMYNDLVQDCTCTPRDEPCRICAERMRTEEIPY